MSFLTFNLNFVCVFYYHLVIFTYINPLVASLVQQGISWIYYVNIINEGLRRYYGGIREGLDLIFEDPSI